MLDLANKYAEEKKVVSLRETELPDRPVYGGEQVPVHFGFGIAQKTNRVPVTRDSIS